MWSSAVAHVLKAPTLFSCVFRDAVTSGYSSYCCLPIGLKQSGHSSLMSGINKTFSPTEPLLTANSLVFWLLSVNSRVKNPEQSSNF